MGNFRTENEKAEDQKWAPLRAHEHDAGSDVYSSEDIIVKPHSVANIGLRFGIKIPEGFMGAIYPRTSMAKKGLIAQLPPIDPGYTGEVHGILINTTNEPIEVKKNDRIGQLVIHSIVEPEFVSKGEPLKQTFIEKARGSDAFGSTGR